MSTELQVKPKEKKILEALMAGKSLQEAADLAGVDMAPENAKTYAKHVRQKYTDANGHLLVALDKVGVNFDKIAGTIRDGLEAKSSRKSGKEIVEVPDHSIRHKYLETAIDVMGAKAPTKQITEQITTHEQTIAIVDGIRSDPEALAALQRRLKERRNTIETTSYSVDPGEESDVAE